MSTYTYYYYSAEEKRTWRTEADKPPFLSQTLIGHYRIPAKKYRFSSLVWEYPLYCTFPCSSAQTNSRRRFELN